MAEPASCIRAFIAINLPPELATALARLQRQLQATPGGAAVRWTPAEQIHLTLRFLGDVPADAVPELTTALQRAGAAASPFELAAEGLGCFPNERKPRIVWVGITGATATLQQLQAQVADATQAWGESEAREFRPHLTVGRVKSFESKSVRALADTLRAHPKGSLGTWQVTQVALMQSVLSPQGAQHTQRAALPLG